MYCQTASYFSVCTLSYDINRQLCTFKDNDWIDPSRSACLAKVPNCKLCLYGISYLCSLCASGYYLVKDGTCVANCPVKSYKYEFQPVCVNRVINDCLKEKIGNMNYLIQLTWPTQTSVGYQYYLSSNFKTVNILNDPIGIVFWNYPKTSNAFPSERMTTISSSLSQCSVCNPGFGFVKKRFCAPCNPSCKTCIKSKSKYCTSCPEYHYLTAANACVKNPPEGYPCQLLFSYRNESGICQ